MSKDDLVTLKGKITDMSGGGVYHVALDNGHAIKARLCGKMKKFNIKVVVGDSVDVGISPYDVSHGLITQRHKVVRLA